MHVAACLAIAAFTAGPSAAPAAVLPAIAVEKYTLPNGLQVILHEDHATPIVTVNVWYHVGSKNERPGRTGFAHLFEHMMFEGSQHHPDQYVVAMQQLGGRVNGSTNQDCTNYWETVPAQHLATALWMESDRMGFLLPAMTQAKFENQRAVVKNERRQRYDNLPYGVAVETLLAALYPPQNPYSWPTIGSMTDLDRATRDDVAAFFRRYYHPANASLCIVGDFLPAEAKRLVARYFGPLPPGPRVEKVAVAPTTLREEQRIRMTDRVALPRLYVSWPSAAAYSADEAALEVLCDILAAGKTSRLGKVLTNEKQLAQSVSLTQHSHEQTGHLTLIATLREGRSLADLQTAVDEELRRAQDQPPAAEDVTRAINRYEARLVRALESASGFGGLADRLNRYNVFTGDPNYLARDYAQYAAVTPAAVQQAACKYFGKGRVVLEVVPGKELCLTPDPRQAAEKVRAELARAASPEPALPPVAVAPEGPERIAAPQPAAPHPFYPPRARRMRLSSGLEVLLVERHELPIVSLSLVLPMGRTSDPADKLGLVNLMCEVWDNGTTHHSGSQIADQLASSGATMSIVPGWDSTVARLFTLKRNLPETLELFADVLRHPTFPDRSVTREKKRILGQLAQLHDEATSLARLAVARTLYGEEHPYGRCSLGTPANVQAITRNDLHEFYRGHIRPHQGTLIAVGDITRGELMPQLERAFGHWEVKQVKIAPPSWPEVPAPRPTRIVLVDKPGAAQSVICAAQMGIPRASPDYHAAAALNSIFGGQFGSRLNMNLREAKGYTYGARSAMEYHIAHAGYFAARASVQTAVTAPALTEMLEELRALVGSRPPTAAELRVAQVALAQVYPTSFETVEEIAGQWESLVEFRLPDETLARYIPAIEALTPAEVTQTARRVLDPAHLVLVVVGDRAKIEPSLRALPERFPVDVLRFDSELRLRPAVESTAQSQSR